MSINKVILMERLVICLGRGGMVSAMQCQAFTKIKREELLPALKALYDNDLLLVTPYFPYLPEDWDGTFFHGSPVLLRNYGSRIWVAAWSKLIA